MLTTLALMAKIPTAILVFGIVVIVAAIFLIIAVLMQQGKQHNISGTIAGAADTFFGKTKGSTISKKLSVVTSVVAILFVILVLAFYIVQTPNDTKAGDAEETQVETSVDTSDAETEAATGEAETEAATGEAETEAATAEAETEAATEEATEAAE